MDGFVLADPQNVATLTSLVHQLYEDVELRTRIGDNAARTAQSYTWDRNAHDTWDFLTSVCTRKRQAAASQASKVALS